MEARTLAARKTRKQRLDARKKTESLKMSDQVRTQRIERRKPKQKRKRPRKKDVRSATSQDAARTEKKKISGRARTGSAARKGRTRTDPPRTREEKRTWRGKRKDGMKT